MSKSFKFNNNLYLDMCAILHPVGEIYITTDSSFNPNNNWVGTWELIKNKFLVGAGGSYAVNSTGGGTTTSDSSSANTGAHTLTIDEMPSHTHQLDRGNYGNARWEEISYSSGSSTATNANGVHYTGGGKAHSHTMSHTHTITPPYIGVYMWHRIS